MNYLCGVFLIRFSSLGDVILAAKNIPLLVKKGYLPIVVTSVAYKAVLERVDSLQCFICIDDRSELFIYLNNKILSKSEFVSYYKSLNFQKNSALIDLQRTSRSRHVIKLVKNLLFDFSFELFLVEKRVFYRFFLILCSLLNFSQRINPVKLKKIKTIHEIQLNLLNKLFLKDGKKAEILDSNKYLINTDQSFSEPYVCIFPGSSGFIKNWPKEYFRKLICLILEKTELKVFICGSQAEEMLGEYLIETTSNRVENYVGKKNVGEVLDLISRATFVVTNDSFAGHAAAAYHVQAAVIFGSTSPLFGFTPWYKKISLHYSHLKCSPCTRHGKGNCRYQNLKCFTQISAEEVFESINDLITTASH